VGIDAALYSGSKCYFFAGTRYIRVTRGDTGAGTVDTGYPKSISLWRWPSGFGTNGIDAALYSGSKCYFFDGDKYIRVTRGDTGAGTVDAGYPKSISLWRWPTGFGMDGFGRFTDIDAALYSGSRCYFFDGNRYIRVTRGDTGAGTVDAGYPKSISLWRWPTGFGEREFILIHFKSLLVITSQIQAFMTAQFNALQQLYAVSGIEARRGTTEDLSNNTDLSNLLALDVGNCFIGQPTGEIAALFANRNNVGRDDLVVYVVQTLVGTLNFLGCAAHPDDQPGAAIMPTNAAWLAAHEVGHVLGLQHVPNMPLTNSDFLMWQNVLTWSNPPPNISSGEASTMIASRFSRPF
jgi:hypothetical protein